MPTPYGPEDERAFLAQMVADRRLVILVRVPRLYGAVLAVAGGG